MSTVTKRCSLCFKIEDDAHLICKESLQLCPKCYAKWNESGYEQKLMLVKSIKCYRQLVEKYEDTSGTKINTDFEGIS